MSLEIKKLKKRMNERDIIKGVDLTIPEGEIYGFLGANGAGKTTIFRHILGIYTPDSGEITWKGRKIDRFDAAKVGYLPEERGLYPKRTVKQQLTFFGKLHKMNKRGIEKSIAFWLDFFDIKENIDRKISELSKGNQQKIQFIASIIHSPELVILDEPFSGLDPINANQLKEAILFLKEKGSTIIFSSHQMANVEEICENICMIKKGEVLLKGNLQEIKNGTDKRKVIVQADFEREALKREFEIASYKEKNNVVSFYAQDEFSAKKIQKFIFQSENIQQFRIEPVSLNDIFLERVGE
ncbi:ATP-binding cassette domain-containing protein [Enterococcus sp. DIV0242_7C1]|uniref:ABC superfamily ATP binding cassette transporter ABC protein n=1 Tax=Candidatus Enterococcus dunnyi TaxID=1834192 RepID=A0A200J1F0_9ENTE|nr:MULTISPECIES: ATP-binding cassette domain-containing protein [unclassified Enterococcus]MBO0470020.1 ATP-binding cassette domain-containing protein [Enterococcus sp. DIV0242_7C1]OUZ30470.1 ABC superfamily ATP binding cassette transporter ABC protein [Enterococcus sp. 9D6_DIV0238]